MAWRPHEQPAQEKSAFFFEAYCLRCHHSEFCGDDRNGAHPLVNFDTYAGATGSITSTRSVPKATREVLEVRIMPFDDVTEPTGDELGCAFAWLDQGTPEQGSRLAGELFTK